MTEGQIDKFSQTTAWCYNECKRLHDKLYEDRRMLEVMDMLYIHSMSRNASPDDVIDLINQGLLSAV